MLNEIEIERRETEPNVVYPARFGSTKHNETPQKKSNKTRENQELHKQVQKQGTFTITRSGWISRKPERLLLLGHCDANQVDMHTSSHTKICCF